MKSGGSGSKLKVSATQAVAVYDPSNGRVVHWHEVVVFEGGKAVSREQAEQEATDAARRHGHDIGKLRTLHMSEPPEPGVYRIDLEKEAPVLIPQPEQPPARKR